MRRLTAGTDYKKRWGEFGVFVYDQKSEQGRVRLHESLKSAASGFERLTVRFCEHALSVHIYLYPLAVCAGRGDEDGQKDVQNIFLSPKTLFRGALKLDRDVQAELSVTTLTPLL